MVDTNGNGHSNGNGHTNGNGRPGFLPRRWLDFIVITQVVITIFILGFTMNLMINISRQQTEGLQNQNNLQLCVQHDLAIAIRQIGEKLGLPVEDIFIPKVKGLTCDS